MSKLGSLLVREGLLTESDRRTIRRESGTHRGSFARSVIALGILDEHELAALFASKTSYRIAPKNLSGEIERETLNLIPAHILTWLDVMPIRKANGVLFVAMVDPTDGEVISQLEFFSGMTIKPVVAPFSAIHEALKDHLTSRLEFGSSEFEEFLKNHSAHATKFAAGKVRKKSAVKARPVEENFGPSSESAFDSSGSAFDSDSEFGGDSQGGLEIMTETTGSSDQSEGESMAFDSPTDGDPASFVPAATDDFSDASSVTMDDEPVDDASANASMTADDLNLLDDPAAAEQGAAAISEPNNSPDLDMDLGGLEDDVIFNTDEEEQSSHEPAMNADLTSDAQDLASVDASAANMDDLLAVKSDSTEEIGVNESNLGLDETPMSSASSEVSPSTPKDELSVMEGDEIGSLSLDQADELSEPEESMQSEVTENLAQVDVSIDSDFGPDIAVSGDIEADGTSFDVNASLSDPSNPLESSDAFAMEHAEHPTGTEADALSLDDLSANGESFDEISAVDDLVADPEISSEFSASLSQEPIISSHAEISGEGHSGIAALNRALVNMALMMDGKKALTRLADAAGQVGISSGAVLKFTSGIVEPGVMWNRIDGKLGTIQDVPAGFNADLAKDTMNALTGAEGWMPLSSSMSPQSAQSLLLSWPNTEQPPTHAMMRAGNDGSVIISLVRFADDAQHEGLKQSFAELIKAVAPKM